MPPKPDDPNWKGSLAFGHVDDQARAQVLYQKDSSNKEWVGQFGTRNEYELTARGKDLVTLLTGVRQWGDRWVFGPGNERTVLHDRKTGRPSPACASPTTRRPGQKPRPHAHARPRREQGHPGPFS